jgi:hypothetical protein
MSQDIGRHGKPTPRYALGVNIKELHTVARNPICCFVGRRYFLWMLVRALCERLDIPRVKDIAV